MSKKNNQIKRSKSYKNDTGDLVELGQFLRDAFKDIRIEREWCVFYDINENFLGIGKNMLEGRTCKFKTPDIMVIKDNKLLCCVELDGSVHDTVAFGDTLSRNELYEKLNIPLVIISKSTLEISMFDDAYNKVKPYIEGNMNAE